MSPASSHFIAALQSWSLRQRQAQGDISDILDDLFSTGRVLRDYQLFSEQKQTSDLQELDTSSEELDARWNERLKRADLWSEKAGEFRVRLNAIESTARHTAFFDRFENQSAVWAARFHRLADHLEVRRAVLSQRLQDWVTLLTTREVELQSLTAVEDEEDPPLLISRARKQPETQFVEDQKLAEIDIGADLLGLRRAITHFRDRLLKGSRLLEERAMLQPARFEVRRRPIEEEWKPVNDRWLLLREETLRDALVFESARRKLRLVSEAVDRLPCVEDLYEPVESWWKKTRSFLSFKK